jgi:hypothetical protein
MQASERVRSSGDSFSLMEGEIMEEMVPLRNFQIPRSNVVAIHHERQYTQDVTPRETRHA